MFKVLLTIKDAFRLINFAGSLYTRLFATNADIKKRKKERKEHKHQPQSKL